MPEEEKRSHACAPVGQSVWQLKEVAPREWFTMKIWDAYRLCNKQMDELNEIMGRLGIWLSNEPDVDIPEWDSMEAGIARLQYAQYSIGRAITLIRNTL